MVIGLRAWLAAALGTSVSGGWRGVDQLGAVLAGQATDDTDGLVDAGGVVEAQVEVRG